ncbi:MAG: 30S ribosomal protein S17 [Promethearchaeota archaeon]
MSGTKDKVRNIGIPNIEAPEKVCDDKYCPFHGKLSVRSKVREGIVRSTRMHKTIVFQTDYLSLIKKYSRYERRRSKKLAHLPSCIEVKVGDTVKVVDCRPISKNVSAVVVAVTPAEVRVEEE